jgi:sigma-B regulation protein RsbU (phosphoserine phosphatase)
MAKFDESRFSLFAGDRLIIVSDGVTECEDNQHRELGQDGFARMVDQNRHLTSMDMLEAMMWDLQSHRQGADFADDVSAVIFDFLPNSPTKP